MPCYGQRLAAVVQGRQGLKVERMRLMKYQSKASDLQTVIFLHGAKLSNNRKFETKTLDNFIK